MSETNPFNSFTTAKMKPFVSSEAGKALVEARLPASFLIWSVEGIV